MTTLAPPVHATAGADRPAAWALARGTVPWRAIAAETMFVLGLGASCVALVALRLAVIPQDFIPKDLAFTALGAAVLAALATFMAARAARPRQGAGSPPRVDPGPRRP